MESLAIAGSAVFPVCSTTHIDSKNFLSSGSIGFSFWDPTLVAVAEDSLHVRSGAVGALGGGACGVGLLLHVGSESEVSLTGEGC